MVDHKSIFLKVIKTGIFLTLLTPLILGPFGLSFSNYPKAVFFRTLVEVIFIFYLLLIFFDTQYLPKTSPLVLAISIFVGISVLSGLVGINFNRSFWGELYRDEGIILYLHLLVFFLIIISVFRTKKEWMGLFKLAVIVSAISSFAGILQKLRIFSFYGIDLPNRISGTWTNPDFFAPYIVLTIFIAIFLLAVEKKGSWKIVWAAILALNCFTLILSGTRAAWIGFGIGLIFLFSFWLFGCSNLNHKKREAILLGILILSILFLGAVLSQDYLSLAKNSTFQRMIGMFDWNSGSVQSRLRIWGIALDGWKDKPILGWGPESFGFVFDKYFKADYIKDLSETTFYDRPHNKVLGLMSTTGILGTLSYFSIFFIIFYLLFSNKKRKISETFLAGIEERPKERAGKKDKIFIYNLILAALFIAYFFQNLFCFDTVGTYLIFFLIMGFINNNFSSSQSKFYFSANHLLSNGMKKFLKISFASIFIPLSLVIFYQLNFKPTLASHHFFQAAKLEKKDFRIALSEYQKGVSSDTLFDKEFRRILVERLMFILGEINLPGNIRALIDKELISLKPFLENDLRKPDERYLESYELLASINEEIYLSLGDKEALKEMEEISKEALNFNDQKPRFYQLVGEAKILQKNYLEGEFFFQKSFELGQKRIEDKINFYKILATAYFKAGDKEKAAKNFKKALDEEFCLEKNAPLSLTKVRTTINFAEALAKFYYQDLNDEETARQIYERGMDIFPGFKKQLQFDLETLMKSKNTGKQ